MTFQSPSKERYSKRPSQESGHLHRMCSPNARHDLLGDSNFAPAEIKPCLPRCGGQLLIRTKAGASCLTTTAENQGEIGMSQQQPTNIKTINNCVRNQPAGNVLMKDGCVTTRVPANITVSGGGKFGYDRPDRTPERIAKAQAFHALVLERRKDKSRCPRCGHPRGEKYRTCDRCREKIRKAKLRAKGIAVVKGGEYSNADLAAMVIQMRREMDKMHVRFKLWQKAADYRRNLHYRTNTMRKKYLKTVSHDEAIDYLKTTNHAYDIQPSQP